MFAIHLKNPQKAVEHYKKAIALDKEDGEIRYNYAAVLDHLGNLEEAANEYEMAAQLGVARAQENLRNVKAKIKEKELAASIKKE